MCFQSCPASCLLMIISGPKNKRRKNKDRRRRDYYEDTLDSGSLGVPATASGAGRDTRYNDMAPK